MSSDPAKLHAPWLALRRCLFLGLVLLGTVMAASAMLVVIGADDLDFRSGLALLLFTALFAWIGQSFWTALIGLVLRLFRRDPLSLRRLPADVSEPTALPSHGGTALVMPIYNEDPERAVRGLEACCRSIAVTGQAAHFSVFLLSDSNDPEIAVREQRAVDSLRGRLPASMVLYYRRRTENSGRKAGNLAEFCARWHNHFRYMLVLDADSLMQGETVVRLVGLMERNPRAGLIQTAPMPVRQRTLFGRLMQFGAALYGPLLAAGSSFWQGSTANYWGHNAIIRLAPFHAHCGLPLLPGKPPLGGEIMSHDFVEAALMKRAGWDVWFLSELSGSYEELPGNVIDYARRDRRWAQGNLQHLRLLGERGLHPMSRLHLLMGASSFLVSLLWLVLLLTSWFDPTLIADAGAAVAQAPDAASRVAAEQRHDIARLLFASTVVLLFGPRLMGIVLYLTGSARASRRWRLVGSALLETMATLLLAPLMMLFHCWFLFGVACGRATGWDPQVRDAEVVPWRQSLVMTSVPVALGLLGMLVLLDVPPMTTAWLLPVCLGLGLSPWLVCWTSRSDLGRISERLGLFQSPPMATPVGNDVLEELERLELRDARHSPT